MKISFGWRADFRPSNSSKSTSNTSCSMASFLTSHGHSESRTAFTRPVSSSMSRMEVFLRPTKTRLSASPKENGDMSTSCDMENGRRWRGAVGEFEVVTYISPDCGSTIYVSCAKGSSSKSGSTSRCLGDTSGPRMDGTACAGSFSEEVAVEEEGCGGGEEGMDQSLPPV